MIVILGQTATGKSDFAVEIAKKINDLSQYKSGEIISADSRQVYKDMNLGTGKITKKEMQGVKHYLLDVISPKNIFSVSDFQKLANKEIKNIISKNKIPIICGGTGFYIDALVNGTRFPEVPPNKELREKLSNKTAQKLFDILKKLDKNRAENIDPKNKVRLIRAIEIARALGSVPRLKNNGNIDNKSGTNSAMAEFVPRVNDKSTILKIGLKIPDEILKKRIKARLISRIKKGMIKEIKDLHEKKKITWKRLESFGLEYRYVAYHLQGKLSKGDMVEKLNTEIWHFAKRQNTWFRRDKDILWINPLKNSEKQIAFREIKKFLK